MFSLADFLILSANANFAQDSRRLHYSLRFLTSEMKIAVQGIPTNKKTMRIIFLNPCQVIVWLPELNILSYHFLAGIS